MKPDVVVPALKEVSSLAAAKNKLFISVAMGVSTATIEKVIIKLVISEKKMVLTISRTLRVGGYIQ